MKKLSELSLDELKVIAYDLLVQGEVNQNNLKAVQQEINNRLQAKQQDNAIKGNESKGDSEVK
jgi:hypothetical protein